ncbi:hypothetical protein [Pseudochelatococcus contaminans]|uniref:Uncharacterized protein n=1 Tax=Pseudochelatococcus contaminans TaxID=1538103 RepID=A0A7W5Z3K8_9HYPH|nr:hypothetical protein [Pseudochelatococcus contaminans]MBB3809516.1 hypothetical protein [Pseudochelatococcus contaminans]
MNSTDKPEIPAGGDIPPGPDPAPRLWRRFVIAFIVALVACVGLLAAFTAVVDPYGIRVGAGGAPRPIVDINQRFMYPQLARSGRYDSAVVGTSSLRLLDPEELNRLFGTAEKPARFANLAMNAATPWEQMQLAQLFLRTQPAPKVLVFGLDRSWCDMAADAPEKRLTFRAFPERFYDANRWNDWLDTFNLKSLEIAIRLVSYELGLRETSIRSDGFDVFVPPDETYDAARAHAHIWFEHTSKGLPAAVVPQDPPAAVSDAERAAWTFPAGGWLDDLLRTVPATTRTYLVFPPAHVSAQPRPGALEAATDRACKAALADIGARHDATVLDFRKPSEVTRNDENFWDPLHYRLPFASRIAEALAAPQPGSDFYDIISRPVPSLPSSGQ